MSDVPDGSEIRDGERKPPMVTVLRVIIGLCLVAPFVALLCVSSYAKVDPTFIGIPFFYWYQLLWVLITTVLTVIAHKLWQHDQRSRGRDGGVTR